MSVPIQRIYLVSTFSIAFPSMLFNCILCDTSFHLPDKRCSLGRLTLMLCRKNFGDAKKDRTVEQFWTTLLTAFLEQLPITFYSRFLKFKLLRTMGSSLNSYGFMCHRISPKLLLSFTNSRPPYIYSCRKAFPKTYLKFKSIVSGEIFSGRNCKVRYPGLALVLVSIKCIAGIMFYNCTELHDMIGKALLRP